jgi:hypothetical protein
MGGNRVANVPIGEAPGVPTDRQSPDLGDPLPHVRVTVRALLLTIPAYRELDPPRRRQMAADMVRVCHAAAALLREEILSDKEVRLATSQSASAPAAAPPPDAVRDERTSPPLARAQAAGSSFSGVAASQVAATTRNILNAVSFPRFVTELINGVFKAMIDSSTQQMNSYVELLNSVATSIEGFADSNMGADRARAWLVDRYPGTFDLTEDSVDEDDNGNERRQLTLQLHPGATMPTPAALKADLGLDDSESIPTGDLERTLVPLVRRQLAKTRQEMLATMVMLGMQRIVVDSGRITAAMRFHIDTRSAAQGDEGSTLSFKNQIDAAGSFSYGPWGVSAKMSNTIGYVSTQRTQTTEEMNTDLDLNSSVEINFKSDYLPLNRLASPGQADRIRANSRNPEAEAAQASAEARAGRTATSDQARRDALNRVLDPGGASSSSPAGSPPSHSAGPSTRPSAPGAAQNPPASASAPSTTNAPAAASPTTNAPAATTSRTTSAQAAPSPAAGSGQQPRR